jgi:outer membrane protein assembly factor BamA
MRRLLALIGSLMLLTTVPRLAAQESDELVVRQLQFSGNDAIPDEVLASAIATTNSSWFARNGLIRWIGLGAKRYFDPQEFRRDVVRLGVLY